MSYLNIYPKHIFAALKEDGSYQGEFIYSLEQYGILLEDAQSHIKIYKNLENDGWDIAMRQFDEIDVPYFRKFILSLNNYIFCILRISPEHSSKSSDSTIVEIFFNDVYFDLSGAEPTLKKLSNKAKIK